MKEIEVSTLKEAFGYVFNVAAVGKQEVSPKEMEAILKNMQQCRAVFASIPDGARLVYPEEETGDAEAANE